MGKVRGGGIAKSDKFLTFEGGGRESYHNMISLNCGTLDHSLDPTCFYPF